MHDPRDEESSIGHPYDLLDAELDAYLLAAPFDKAELDEAHVDFQFPDLAVTPLTPEQEKAVERQIEDWMASLFARNGEH